MASVQHACAHREQLLAAGIGRGAIRHRLKTQRYVLLHRTVYLIDPPRADEWTATMAAILSFSRDAVAAGRSAGALWGMLEEVPLLPEVVVVGRNTHTRSGVITHRVSLLEKTDVRWRLGLPVTSPARTAVDLAAGLTTLELEDVLAICLTKRLATVQQIRQAMDRASARKPGIGTLRRLLDQGGFARTRSQYERKLLGMIMAAGLPRPLTNYRIAGHEVDMVWPEQKLVLKFDGFRFHADRRAFERDRRRDQDLVAKGYRVIRVTAGQVEQEPLAVIARLTAALAA